MNRQGDEGFIAVAVAGLVLVLVSVSSLVACLGAVAVARHRAATAADLAALAAAGHALEGEPTACGAAARVAEAQGAVVQVCRLDGADALVQVTVRPVGRLGSLGAAQAWARAGPGQGLKQGTHGR
jgi:secretion/DNA translocation related TadE-like protein